MKYINLLEQFVKVLDNPREKKRLAIKAGDLDDLETAFAQALDYELDEK